MVAFELKLNPACDKGIATKMRGSFALKKPASQYE